MAGLFVQQTEISVASQTSPLTASAITTTGGNALICVAFGTSNMVVTLAGNSNTYSQAPTSAAVDPGSKALQLFYAPNINAGSTVVVATASTGALDGLYVAEYSGLATSAMLINSIGNFQSGPGTTPTLNSVTSGSVTNTVPAMLFGFTYPDNTAVTALPTAGTSPTAFTGRTGVWATFNGNATAPGIPEDAAISASAAATFGCAAGALQFQNFLTVAAVFALAGGGAGTPFMGQICL